MAYQQRVFLFHGIGYPVQIEYGFYNGQSQAVTVLVTAFVFADIRLPDLSDVGFGQRWALIGNTECVVGDGNLNFAVRKRIFYRIVRQILEGGFYQFPVCIDKVVSAMGEGNCFLFGKYPEIFLYCNYSVPAPKA